MMNRSLLLSILALVLSSAAGSQNHGDMPMTLSAPLTHSDWMVHANQPAWGSEGVRHMLEQCKACGWTISRE